jgi:hypothetical protein
MAVSLWSNIRMGEIILLIPTVTVNSEHVKDPFLLLTIAATHTDS